MGPHDVWQGAIQCALDGGGANAAQIFRAQVHLMSGFMDIALLLLLCKMSKRLS